jgi:hypothetical protein
MVSDSPSSGFPRGKTRYRSSSGATAVRSCGDFHSLPFYAFIISNPTQGESSEKVNVRAAPLIDVAVSSHAVTAVPVSPFPVPLASGSMFVELPKRTVVNYHIYLTTKMRFVNEAQSEMPCRTDDQNRLCRSALNRAPAVPEIPMDGRPNIRSVRRCNRSGPRVP